MNRNLNLDFLRLLGVGVIMVAHASPPAWLFQLRNFGTPLLIIASALTYSFIYSNKRLVTRPFFKKRLKRLILPVWYFLLFFFLINDVLYTGTTAEIFHFDFETKVSSFFLFKGIGFVWIFKVYIFLAFLTPFGLSISKKTKRVNLFFIALLVILAIHEAIVFFTIPYLEGFAKELFSHVIFTFVPYALLYLYGMKLLFLNNRKIIVLSISSFMLFGAILFYFYLSRHILVPTQQFKYPPRIYYLSYAFGCVNLIYLFIRKIVFKNPKTNQIIIWLSSKSLWIYLWHIFAWYLWDVLMYYGFVGSNQFLLKVVFLFGFGIILAYFQSVLITRFIGRDSRVGRYVHLVFN